MVLQQGRGEFRPFLPARDWSSKCSAYDSLVSDFHRQSIYYRTCMVFLLCVCLHYLCTLKMQNHLIHLQPTAGTQRSRHRSQIVGVGIKAVRLYVGLLRMRAAAMPTGIHMQVGLRMYFYLKSVYACNGTGILQHYSCTRQELSGVRTCMAL